MYGGAAGGGKSMCLIMHPLRWIGYPDYRAVIFRRTFPQLREIIDRTWQWYPLKGGEYKANEHRWHFPGGAKITLSHMQHDTDRYSHQGVEYHGAYFDEVTQFTPDQYLYLFSRIRGTNPKIPLMVRATTNPGGISHHFHKSRFIDACEPGKTYIDPKTGMSRVYIPGTVYDNPALALNDPQYVKRLEALPEIEKKRLLYGDWDTFAGQVFTELSQRVHGCDPFEIPPEWTRIQAFDWGFAKPFAALWGAVDFNDTIYIYRELYGMKPGEPNVGVRMTNDQICDEIRKAERERVNLRVADPACWSPTMKANHIIGPSFAEDASRHGLFYLKADNDRLRGKAQVHQRLQLDNETNAEGEVTREWPRLVIFNSCKHLWRTMEELQEDEKNPEEIDPKAEDHLYDVLRYLVMSRPLVPKLHDEIPKGSFAYERRRLIRAKDYSRRHGVSLEAAYGKVR